MTKQKKTITEQSQISHLETNSSILQSSLATSVSLELIFLAIMLYTLHGTQKQATSKQASCSNT